MSSGLGHNQEAKIEERLKNLQYKNLHSVLKEKQNALILGKTRNKLKNTLESIREVDQEIFYEVPFFGNLLTLLYLDVDTEDDDDATELNDEILDRFPDDKTALQNKVDILLADKSLHEAEEVLQQLEDDQSSKFHYCSCLVDQAFLYYSFPPKFYSKAVKLFCQALNGVKRIQSERSPDDALDDGADIDMIYAIEKMTFIWKYYLIVTYNRLINAGNIMSQILSDGEERLTPTICFQRIYDISKDVINSPIFKTHKTYAARTLVELYDAHFKMKYPLRVGKCECCLCIDDSFKTVLCLNPVSDNGASSADGIPCQNSSIDYLLQYALMLAPKDGHVIEKYGRNKRTKSKSLEDFKEAESKLRECVQLYPGRYVAWHQLGLTYMNMWKYQLEGNKQVFDNPIRTGKQEKKKKKGRKKKDRYDPLDGYCALAIQVTKSKNQADDNVKVQQKCSSQPQQNNSQSPRLEAEAKITDANESDLSGQRIVNNQGRVSGDVVVVQPKYPTDFGTLPKHRKHRDWFDHFRTNNPQYDDHSDTVPDLLKKALECFQKASSIVNDNQCRLLIDLGRCLVSMKRSKEAEKCFKKASKCETATEHELAYVYEQWALLLHEMNVEKIFNDEKLCTRVKSLYRHSVENSVTAKEKSRVAFYNLRDILWEETIRSPADLCAKKESALLEMVVENYEKAKVTIHKILSVEGWKQNKELRHLAWDLVEIFYKMGQFEDAWSYMNMNLLLSADKSKCQLILDVGLNAAKEISRDYFREQIDEVGDGVEKEKQYADADDIGAERLYGPVCQKSQEIYVTVFTTLIKMRQFPARTVSMVNASDQDKEVVMPRWKSADNKLNIQPHDVLLVMDNNNHEPAGYWEVKLLLHHCGLTVLGDEEIAFGTRVVLSTLQDYSEQSTSVLIFTDEIDNMELLKTTSWNIFINRKKFSQPVACIRGNKNEHCEFLKKSKLCIIDVKEFMDEIVKRHQNVNPEIESSQCESQNVNPEIESTQCESTECRDQMKEAMIYELFRTLCIDCFEREYE